MTGAYRDGPAQLKDLRVSGLCAWRSLRASSALFPHDRGMRTRNLAFRYGIGRGVIPECA